MAERSGSLQNIYKRNLLTMEMDFSNEDSRKIQDRTREKLRNQETDENTSNNITIIIEDVGIINSGRTRKRMGEETLPKSDGMHTDKKN